MGLFRRKKPVTDRDEPVPDWNDTRWRALLRAHTTDIDHHCNIYFQFIKDDRKEAARHFKNDDISQARSYAESSLRHQRVAEALANLSSISNQLYQRTESLAGFTSLFQIPEPARSGIVTIIFVAGRLHMKYLSETVNFLRQQFGPVHVDAIQKGEGELHAFVNHTVRESLSPGSALQEDIDKELALALREFFGVSMATRGLRGESRRTMMNGGDGGAKGMEDEISPSEIRRAQTTPLSAASSEMPISPQISDLKPPRRMTEEATGPPPRTSRAQEPERGSTRYHRSAVVESGQQQGRNDLQRSYPKPNRNHQNPQERYYGQGADQHQAEDEDYGGYMQRNRSGREGDGVANLLGNARRGSIFGSSLVGKVTTSTEATELDTGALGGARTTNPAQITEGQQSDRGIEDSEREAREEFRLPEHLKGFKDSDEMLLRKYDHLCGALLSPEREHGW